MLWRKTKPYHFIPDWSFVRHTEKKPKSNWDRRLCWTTSRHCWILFVFINSKTFFLFIIIFLISIYFVLFISPLVQMKLQRPLIWNVISQTILLLVAQWELGCSGMTLNSVFLPRAPRRSHGARAGALAQRHKRSWVWNQFFVLEEFTGDEPLYVGKVRGSVKIETLTAQDNANVDILCFGCFHCQLDRTRNRSN